MATVYVIMTNDVVDCVFSNERAAAEHVRTGNEKDDAEFKKFGRSRIYYRYYAVELDPIDPKTQFAQLAPSYALTADHYRKEFLFPGDKRRYRIEALDPMSPYPVVCRDVLSGIERRFLEAVLIYVR